MSVFTDNPIRVLERGAAEHAHVLISTKTFIWFVTTSLQAHVRLLSYPHQNNS
jgi:hypothetical protein